jgi:hypothetical protein
LWETGTDGNGKVLRMWEKEDLDGREWHRGELFGWAGRRVPDRWVGDEARFPGQGQWRVPGATASATLDAGYMTARVVVTLGPTGIKFFADR